MKKYDKNSLIGFVLMAIILIVFNTFFFPEIPQEKAPVTTPNETQFTETQFTETTVATPALSNSFISEELKTKYGVFASAANGTDEFQVIENDKLKITVANKGGRIVSVILKEYQTFDSLALDLFDADSSRFNLQFTTGHNINTADLYFFAEQSSNTLSMKLKADDSHYVEYLYTLTDDYLIDFDIKFIGMESLIPSGINYMNLEWQMKTPQTEKSKTNQDMYTGIQYQYSADNEGDYLSFTSTDEDEINARLNWVAFKQQFFSAIFIAKDGFEKPTHLISTKSEGSKFIKDLAAKFELPYQHRVDEQLSFQFYFGPNHFKTLKAYNSGFEELVPLGWGIFGWVNQYIIINIFDFLSKYFSSYGIIILLLTLIIKIGLAPFTYKAFLSQAKMKVLKPEIDKINDKLKGKDPMKAQQETMGLYRKAGVNPMGGCLPMLFQFPILIAMFRFFPASIELRQESFLWADDLSSYDSIYNLGFDIPFYGDHISLFTLLMTVSTLLYTRMNSSMATGQMAQMKWMMYLMPIMFLGFFNNYAAGLSYYYFLANMFTFTQQYFMKVMINEDEILAQLEANKKKPAKPKSKFQKKLEDMQKKQEQQIKGKKKK
ncbi:MAG: Membrane protein insertase YidC [Cryomorphaceae bacterium]|nr:MAG: Membrane protein insertase YidC [Cryomorphaceae bacterium]